MLCDKLFQAASNGRISNLFLPLIFFIGDMFYRWQLDRLGRDLRHLINTVHDLTTRSIGLKVLTGRGESRLGAFDNQLPLKFG